MKWITNSEPFLRLPVQAGAEHQQQRPLDGRGFGDQWNKPDSASGPGLQHDLLFQGERARRRLALLDNLWGHVIDTCRERLLTVSPAPAPTGLSVTGFTACQRELELEPRDRRLPVQAGAEHQQQRPLDGCVGSETGGTSGTATGLDCDTTYYFRVSARGDGSPYSTTFGDTSSTRVESDL